MTYEVKTLTSTVAPGASQTYEMRPGDVLTVVAPPNVKGTITETPLTIPATDTTSRLDPRVTTLDMIPATRNFGPYATGANVTVVNSSNSSATLSCVKTLSQMAAYSLDTSGNVTGLVGPDGDQLIEFESGASLTAEQYVLRNPTSAADHGTVTGSGAVTAYESIDGVPVVSITAAAGVSTTINFSSFVGRLIPDGTMSFGFYVHDMVTLSSLTLHVGDGSSFTNSFSVQLSDSSAFPCNGWYELIVDPNAVGDWSTLTESSQRKWAIAAGSPSFDSTLFTNAKAVIVTDSGTPCKVSFAECVIGKKAAKGQIVFVMDDGGSTNWTRGLPILERFNLKASLGIISTQVGNANYMTLAQLQNLVSRGHECVVHGATTLTSLPDMAAVETEIRTHRDYLVHNGLAVNDSEKIYIYPQNVLRGGILGVGGEILRAKLVELGFIGARTTSVTGFLSSKFTGLGSRWMVPEIGHRAATDTEANETANVDRVILRMQQAVALGRGVIITNHNIVADTPGTAPTSTIDIQVSNFKRIAKAAYDLVSSGRAENVLLSEAVKRSMSATI